MKQSGVVCYPERCASLRATARDESATFHLQHRVIVPVLLTLLSVIFPKTPIVMIQGYSYLHTPSSSTRWRHSHLHQRPPMASRSWRSAFTLNARASSDPSQQESNEEPNEEPGNHSQQKPNRSKTTSKFKSKSQSRPSSSSLSDQSTTATTNTNTASRFLLFTTANTD